MGPALAMARYKPRRSPRTTIEPASRAPASPTALPTNSMSLASFMISPPLCWSSDLVIRLRRDARQGLMHERAAARGSARCVPASRRGSPGDDGRTMTSLLERPTGSPLDVRPAPVAAAVAAAAQAAAASLVAVLAPVVLAWVLDSDGRGTWLQAVRFALALWLLAQHGGLTVDGGDIGVVPLRLALAPLAACWYGGRGLSRVLDPKAEAIAAGATRAAPSWPPAVALASFAGTYCLVAAPAGLAAGLPAMHPIGLQAGPGGAVVSFVCGTLGAAAYRHRGFTPGLLRTVRTLPAPVVGWAGPAVAAVLAQLAAAAVVVAALLAVGHGHVLELHRALDPGVAGGAVLTLGQVLLLPNLVVWAAAGLAGPGFAVGAATSVTLWSSHLGPLPALPARGALPAPGPLPRAALALLAVPVLT